MRLLLAAVLYALSAGVIVVVLVSEPEAAVKVGLFLVACALVTGGTLALPSDTRKVAATAATVFLAAAGLISTLLSLGAGEESSDSGAKPRPAASYAGRIAHGSALPAYEWLASRTGQVVKLNMLIDLTPIEGMGPRARDKADYVSAEFNEVVRLNGAFRVVETDPDVGSTQVYAVVLDPNVPRSTQ